VGFVVAERAYRPRVPGGRSSRRAGFTLSPEEAALLEERAAAAGLSVSVYVAGRALSEDGGSDAERRVWVGQLWALERSLCELVVAVRGRPDGEQVAALVRPVVEEIQRVVSDLVGLGVRP
jgi:hypothetical protein